MIGVYVDEFNFMEGCFQGMVCYEQIFEGGFFIFKEIF